jgi:PTS system galactitol-specific IIB component
VKRVLVVCGTAIATSTLVAMRIREAAEAEGLQVQMTQARASEVSSYAGQVDLIVSSVGISTDVGVPVISAIPLLTGVGEHETMRAILTVIREG